MPIDITGNIPRWEADDTRQFTMTATVNRPSTVAFIMFNTDGRSLAPEAVQSGATVAESGTNTGLFYFNRVLPTSTGLYFYEWRSWDAASRTYIVRGEFEAIRTEPHSFWTYADIMDVVRTGRQIFQRGDITQRDMRPYLEAADGYIDGKLGMVMTVPVTPTPAIITDMSKIFSLAYFYSDRYSIEREAAPPAILQRKEWYEEYLSSVLSGTAVLVTSGGVTTRVVDEINKMTGSIDDGTPTFGLRDWPSQKVDADILDDEADRDD